MPVLDHPSELNGDLRGPTGATDEALARFDGTSGKLLQNSGVLLDDNDVMTGVTALQIDGTGTGDLLEVLRDGGTNGYLAVSFDGNGPDLSGGPTYMGFSIGASEAMRIDSSGNLVMNQHEIKEVDQIDGGALVSDILHIAAHTAAMVDPDADGKVTFHNFLTFNGITDFTGTTDANFQVVSWDATVDCSGQGIVIPQGFWWTPTIQYDTPQSFGGAAVFQDGSVWEETALLGAAHGVFSVGSFLGSIQYKVGHAGAATPPSMVYGYDAGPRIDAGTGTLTVPEMVAYATNRPFALKTALGLQQLKNGAVCTLYTHLQVNSGNANALILAGGSTITTEVGLDIIDLNQGATAISIRSNDDSAYMDHAGEIRVGWGSANGVVLRDPQIYLASLTDGYLDVVADTAIRVTTGAYTSHQIVAGSNNDLLIGTNHLHSPAGQWVRSTGLSTSRLYGIDAVTGLGQTQIYANGVAGLQLDNANTVLSTVYKLGIGTVTVPHAGIGAALLALEGASSSISGPHIQTTTPGDEYPLMQLLSWSHDNIGIAYDAYWNGSTWSSSDVGSNFLLYKSFDLWRIFTDSGVAQGGAITWIEALAVAADGEVTISSSGALKTYWRDDQIYIASLADGYLDVVADTQIRLGCSTSVTNAANVNALVVNSTGTQNGLFISQNAVLDNARHAAYVYSNSAQVNTGNLLRLTMDNAASSSTVFYIDNDGTGPSMIVDGGKVGIGATPDDHLHVNSSTPLKLSNGAETVRYLQRGADKWGWLTSGAHYLMNWILSTGVVDIETKLGVGTDTVPHGGVGAAKLAIEGTDANVAGPHVQFTTSVNDYPLMQMFMWTHDNIALWWDAYFDGTSVKSSDPGSNFEIRKLNDVLRFSAETAIAAGAAVTFVTAFQVAANAEVTMSPGAALWTYWRDAQIGISSQTDGYMDFEADLGYRFGTSSVEIDADEGYYFGPVATDGTWRIIRSGNDLVIERREAGAYVTKSTISA